MAKHRSLDWVRPVLEDLRSFLDAADEPELVRDLQGLLDRHASRFNAWDGAPDGLQGCSAKPATVVPLRRRHGS